MVWEGSDFNAEQHLGSTDGTTRWTRSELSRCWLSAHDPDPHAGDAVEMSATLNSSSRGADREGRAFGCLPCPVFPSAKHLLSGRLTLSATSRFAPTRFGQIGPTLKLEWHQLDNRFRSRLATINPAKIDGQGRLCDRAQRRQPGRRCRSESAGGLFFRSEPPCKQESCFMKYFIRIVATGCLAVAPAAALAGDNAGAVRTAGTGAEIVVAQTVVPEAERESRSGPADRRGADENVRRRRAQETRYGGRWTASSTVSRDGYCVRARSCSSPEPSSPCTGTRAGPGVAYIIEGEMTEYRVGADGRANHRGQEGGRNGAGKNRSRPLVEERQRQGRAGAGRGHRSGEIGGRLRPGSGSP